MSDLPLLRTLSKRKHFFSDPFHKPNPDKPNHNQNQPKTNPEKSKPTQTKPRPSKRKAEQSSIKQKPTPPRCHHAVPAPPTGARGISHLCSHTTAVPHPCYTTCAIRYMKSYPVQNSILEHQSTPPKSKPNHRAQHFTHQAKPNQCTPINSFHCTTLDTSCTFCPVLHSGRCEFCAM